MSELKENQSPPTSPKRFGLVSKIVFASLLLLGSLNCFKERFFRVYGPSDPRLPCIANLKMIDGAVQQWALENRLSTNAPCTLWNPDVLLEPV